MKKTKFRLAATSLAFLIGIIGVSISGFLFSPPVISNIPQNLSTQIELPVFDKALIEETFNNVEIPPNQPLETKKDLGVFNPTGDYHPVNRSMDKSEKFIQFDLQVRRKKGKLVAWGEIRGMLPWYKFTTISVTEKHLKFSTAKIDGVEYDFNGKFLGKGDFSSAEQSGNIMLEGTLRKFVNGKQVMEISTTFNHYPGC
jgi:hypothetical protein